MDQLIKQIRKELIPVLDRIIYKLDGSPIPNFPSTSKGGLALLKLMRLEFTDRINRINSLIEGKKPVATPPAPSLPPPAPAAKATSRRSKASDSKVEKADGDSANP